MTKNLSKLENMNEKYKQLGHEHMIHLSPNSYKIWKKYRSYKESFITLERQLW